MTQNRILAALVEARSLLRSEGNPNHDAEGKFASSPDGKHGKHWAKRQRRRKRLQHKVKTIRADRTEMRTRHKTERAEHVKEERSDRRVQRREHAGERKSLLKGQAKERRDLERDHVKELRREKDPAEHPAIRESHEANRVEQAGEHRRERVDLRKAQKDERSDLKATHDEARQSIREGHKDERREFVDRTKDELREEFPERRRKDDGQRDGSGAGLAERGPGWRVGGVARASQRFGVGRTHKASSAESIIRHCLRQRGWTGQYTHGQLSGRQRLRLLESIRRYARAWLRHEAEAFFRQYGHEVERGLTGAIARHVGRFFSRAKQFVHETILAGALAFVDPSDEPITEDDMREVDNQAQEQVRYFDRFHQEVATNPPLEIAPPTPSPSALQPMTVKQFVARAEQYGDAAWGAAQQVNRKRMIRGGQHTQEMRVHGKYVDDMCDTCRDAVAQGWVPIGTLPAIGDSECLGNCHCFFKYADADGNVATTVRKMRRRKAG